MHGHASTTSISLSYNILKRYYQRNHYTVVHHQIKKQTSRAPKSEKLLYIRIYQKADKIAPFDVYYLKIDLMQRLSIRQIAFLMKFLP